MIKVGLTGGIGSGKTTAARVFEIFKIPVYYADKQAKILMHSKDFLRAAIKEKFGNHVYEGNILNKKVLAEIIFNDKQALKELNALVHPVVRKDFLEWTEVQDAPYVIEESAILFETGLYKDFDSIVSVICPMEERMQRLLLRDKVTVKQIKARMEAQVDDKIRKEKSDHILKNSKDNLLLPQIIALDSMLRRKLELR